MLGVFIIILQILFRLSGKTRLEIWRHETSESMSGWLAVSIDGQFQGAGPPRIQTRCDEDQDIEVAVFHGSESESRQQWIGFAEVIYYYPVHKQPRISHWVHEFS